jgi:hypothetical protein
MKRHFGRYSLGMLLAVLVGMAAHSRSMAIRGSEPLVPVAEEERWSSLEDLEMDLERLMNEVYDPIRPVSKEGTFKLKLEKAAYASPGVLLSGLFSPLFMNISFHRREFHESQSYRVPLGARISPDEKWAAKTEGTVWGLVQTAAFYAPYFWRRRKVAKEPTGMRPEGVVV